MYAGQLCKATSPKGLVFEYWFGVRKGKRVYLVAHEASLNTFEFRTLREVRSFIKGN